MNQTILQHENCTLLGCCAASRVNLKTGPIGWPETSIRNYHYAPFNNSQESRSQIYRGGDPKSCIYCNMFWWW